jgi:hypothetical protein
MFPEEGQNIFLFKIPGEGYKERFVVFFYQLQIRERIHKMALNLRVN